MNVIIFGATGSIGRIATRRMLDDGHAVTAFARNPAALDIEHPRLVLRAGDVMDPRSTSAAIAGMDAVVVTLGAGASRSSLVRSAGTMNVIRAMHEHGVRRLICQSTLGAHESWANLDFFWKRIMFGLLLRPVHKDHELQESLVRASGLDWTIVRPSAFTDTPATGRYKEGFSAGERALSLKISRADIADFLKRQLTDRRYRQQAVAISN